MCAEEVSVPNLRKLADEGNAEAAEKLAGIYAEGSDENKDAYIRYYYRLALQNGSSTAAEKYADYYYLGDGNSNKNASILYLESVRRNPDDCEREISILTRMFESNWIDPEWKFYADILEVLAENGCREAKHIIRREEVPDPADDFDFESLMAEVIELPEENVVKEEKSVRRWGRQIHKKRALVSVLYDMGIEFTKTSSGLIKTKKGKEIEPEIQKLIERGYKFKYSVRSDKWTIMDRSDSE